MRNHRNASAASRARGRVHWLQHAEHEGLGCIQPWLKQGGHRLSCSRLFAGDPLPAAADFDWLIVMGGPMNIDEEGRYPWLAAEKRLINDAIVTNKKILAICLGAQLLADVLGAKVTRNKVSEIGFFDVTLTSDGEINSMFSGFPDRFQAFHWHGDTFAIPDGCRNLIKSDACVNQVFVKGERAVALQFHLEITADDARHWLYLENLMPERFVQSSSEILRDPGRFEMNNRLMHELLARMDALEPPAAVSATVAGA